MGLFPNSWFLNFCDMLFYFYFTLNSKGLIAVVVVVIQDIKNIVISSSNTWMKPILFKILQTITFKYATKKSVNLQAVPPDISSIRDYKIQLLEE